MVIAGDFKNGVTFEMDGNVMQVIEFQHVKPGKGAAFVRTKLRNVITGAVTETTFNPTDKFPPAVFERRDMQYSYNEEMMCRLVSYKGNVFSVEPPMFVELEVVSTEPGFKGNTATGTTKPATLETGAVIKVPLFIDNGTRLRIDTRTGEYIERA